MRTCILLVSLAVAGSVQAADGFGVRHNTVAEDGQAEARPMSWRYGLLQAARERFEEGVAKQAPGAALSFRLPKTDPAQPGHRVEIVTAGQPGQHMALTMVNATSFALPPAAEVLDDDAQVVANRHFPRDEFNHPNVHVRSPGLPEGVRRVGDLRLACAAQMAMAKEEGFQFRATLVAASMFGFNLCEKLEIAKFDAPTAKYDTVTIEDGEHRLVQAASARETPQLGDKAWSDNARVSYSLGGQPVQ